MRLFVNQYQIDLYPSEKISLTKQVNSLADISKRDSSFTKSFKVPRSAWNTTVFQGLGISGSTSPMPYQKNMARLFVGNICIIFKGWTLFENTSEKDYELYIYDGHIDFMKQLDNKTFDDVNLPELTHTKEVPVIIDNWENGSEFFRYLLADYNGRTHFDNAGTTYINADYLVPSVPVKYLWERIFQTFGFTYSGTIFEDEEFLDLFLTYPKGVTAGEDGASSFSLSFESQPISYYAGFNWSLFRPDLFTLETNLVNGEIIDNTEDPRVKHWKVPTTGHYRIKLTGTLTNNSSYTSFLYLGKNTHEELRIYDTTRMTDVLGEPIATALQDTVQIEIDEVVKLFAGDTLSLYYYRRGLSWDNTTLQLEWEMVKVNQTSIDQIEFFKNLTPKDFYKEILWRFGLTPFPAKDSNHIEFLTYEERINGETLDWSDKFVKQTGEKYVYDRYAKSNYFRFLYNGEGDEFNDGVIRIDNENLEEKVDIVKSKTYSIERNPIEFEIGADLETLPKLELWEKEPTEEEGVVVIQYNPRDARFSFVRENVLVTSAPIGSELLMVYGTANQVRTVEYYDYSWGKILNNRYAPIQSLFKNTKIITAEFHLTAEEFDAFDMKPTIYVEQLGGEFLVDKISKPDLTKKLTKAELIKINR